MSRLRQIILCLAAAVAAMATMTHAQPAPAPSLPVRNLSTATNLLPPMPVSQSPVYFFRQLLAMSPADRNRSLTNRSPEARARIVAKIREYKDLNPDECELRLRATELKWYLMPLFRTPPGERDSSLAFVPDELRDLVKSRLTQWDLLPPGLQQEFLTNDRTLFSVASPASTNVQSQKIAEQFEVFLAMTEAEKQKLLGTLSGPERVQMAKTLQTFGQLPPQQRIQCMRNYAKFAGMSTAERTEFLKNAESWSKMSPQERQTWRDLVAHVPLWPPMPPAAMPPIPNTLPPRLPKAHMATN